MRGLRRALWALAGLGLLFGLAVLALFLTNDTIDAPGAWGAAAVLTGWVFIATGLFAWGRVASPICRWCSPSASCSGRSSSRS
jgi:hypothetical protein